MTAPAAEVMVTPDPVTLISWSGGDEEYANVFPNH